MLPLLAPALLAAVLALALPVASRDDGRARPDADVFDDSAKTALTGEDLAAFRSNKRWGISLQEARENDEAARLEAERQRAEEEERAVTASAGQAAWSPELQAIGFVGVVITAAERVVLLTLPTKSVGRFHVGDRLEDGRRLAAISTRALVLQHEDGERQTVALFPPARPAAGAADVLGASARAEASAPAEGG